MSARRRRNDASGMNLDSLMDTLTNVVGVLIIILILVQINVSRAVKKIVSELPPITVEEHTKLRQQLADANIQRDSLKTAQDDAAKITADLTKANAEFAKLQGERVTDVKLINLDALRAQLEQKRKAVAEEKAAMAAMLAEQDKMKALLAATPAPPPVAPKPAKVVRIPNSRPLPEKAKFSRVLVAHGALYPLDLEGAEALVMREFNNVRQTFVLEKKKDARGQTVNVYDQQKVADFFAKRALTTRNASIAVPLNKYWGRLPMKLTAQPGKGEPVENAARLTSQFANVLRTAKGTNTVIWFHVYRDSFETYLRAREITDATGIPAGWEIAGEPAFAVALNDFEVKPLEPPPTPAPAGDQVVIPPPKRTLD